MQLLDRTTLIIIISTFVTALLTVLPATREIFPLWVIAAGLNIANTLFHECGHTLFYWLFGQPAIPMIFTLRGADQAGGMSLSYNHSWILQIIVFAALGYGCYWIKENISKLFIPAIIFTAFILLMVLCGYEQIIISYMGHGFSILMGGFFLFRALIYWDSRNQFERWLNGLFGFSLILSNFSFSYGLAFNGYIRYKYTEHAAFGVIHNDFANIALEMPALTIKAISSFTMAFCIVTILTSFILAAILKDDFRNKNS